MVKLSFEDNMLANALFGERRENLKLIEKELGINIGVRGNLAIIQGENGQVQTAQKVLSQLYDIVKAGHALGANDVKHAIRMVVNDSKALLKDVFVDNGIYISFRKKLITPKSINQKLYVEAMRHYDLVFGIGPAGTGKTYLAMAMAVAALSNKEVERIILTRPAVEAGERLGFLPGDMIEKVNPYLRPLYDALHDMMNIERAQRFVESGVIEVAPLAFMRGRTLNDSFVILDEAQNTTSEQMKMFLTRLGFSSKAVITGDITQIDLPAQKTSGLVEAQGILNDINDIKFVYFTDMDVVRHSLVQEIIKAYEKKGYGESGLENTDRQT